MRETWGTIASLKSFEECPVPPALTSIVAMTWLGVMETRELWHGRQDSGKILTTDATLIEFEFLLGGRVEWMFMNHFFVIRSAHVGPASNQAVAFVDPVSFDLLEPWKMKHRALISHKRDVFECRRGESNAINVLERRFSVNGGEEHLS